MQPIRHILRYKKASVQFFEADCTSVDPVNKTLTITGISRNTELTKDSSELKGDIDTTQIPFDYLVVGVGAQNSTFGIPGVEQHACFLKEVWDATKIRTRIMVKFLSLG
jgi:NADH:ubiquinone reductase (non-electrogenic)